MSRSTFSQGLLFLPGLNLVGRQAGDGLFLVGRLAAAEAVQEELAVLSLVQGLFVALGIAEYAENFLLDQFGSVGIVLDLADNLLHFTLPFASVTPDTGNIADCSAGAYYNTKGKGQQWTAMGESRPKVAFLNVCTLFGHKIPEKYN